MYNLIAYSSNYFETTGSLWFYSKHEATNVNADIANDNNFKPFLYKAELLGNTEADGDNGILKNAATAVPYVIFGHHSNMTLINCKVDLKLKWTKFCVLSAAEMIILIIMIMIIMVTVSLEFLAKISTQVKRQLIEIFRTCNKGIKLNVVFQSSVRMSNAFRFKDQITKCLNSMLLYKFACNTCNSVYIGKTKRHYLVRQFEHSGLSVFNNKALRYSDKDATAMHKHCHHQTTLIALIMLR